MPHADGQLTGKYRNLLLPANLLQDEAQLLRPKLEACATLHQAKKISDALYATLFVLVYAFHRVLGSEWAKHSRYNYWAEMVTGALGGATPSEADMAPKLRRLPLRGMPGFVFVTLADWLAGHVPLHLATAPVSAAQMLAAQAGGSRVVTVALAEAIAGTLIDNKRDAFEFCLHDLGHAYTFFRAEHEPQGQVRFFSTLENDLPLLQPLARRDPKFAADLEYCMSDMNSHPEHLRQYLRGVIVEAFYRLRKCDTAGQFSEEALSQLLAGLRAVV